MKLTGMEETIFDFWNPVSPISGLDATTATSNPQDFTMDLFPDLQRYLEHERSYNMQEWGLEGDKQQRRRSFGFQTTNAMEFDNGLNSYQAQQVAMHKGLPVPQTTKSKQLPATPPPPTTAHVDALASSLPRVAPRPRKLPKSLQQSLQQRLPAAPHARAAETRGRLEARGPAAAERSARRSRSRSPIRSADVTISDVSNAERDSGKKLASGTTDKDAKKPAIKYKGVSYHTGNSAWRTTVFYKKLPRHMGYERDALKAAWKYDELCLYLWPKKPRKLNFPDKKYPDRAALEAKWLPILEEKVAAAAEKQRKPAKTANRQRKAAGGIRKKTACKKPASKKTAKKGQNRRQQAASSSSDTEITTSDASLESRLVDDADDEEDLSSYRSPPLVATRTPCPKRKAALQAQENWNALKEDLTDNEQDSDEVQPAPAAAYSHAMATAAAERRLRGSQGRNQPPTMMPGVWSSALVQPAMDILPLPAFGLGLEMMDEDAIEDQWLTDLASDPVLTEHPARQMIKAH